MYKHRAKTAVGSQYKDYHSFPEDEDSELLLWISNYPDLCLSPTQHRLGQGLSRNHNTQETTKLTLNYTYPVTGT